VAQMMTKNEKAYLLEFFRVLPDRRECKCLSCGAIFFAPDLSRVGDILVTHQQQSPRCFGGVVVWDEVELGEKKKAGDFCSRPSSRDAL